MSEPPPAGRLTTEHTAFGAHYRTQRGLRLHTPPCDAHRAQLTDPASYAQTQPLGDALRDADVEAFEYRSARETPAGINVAVLSPSALADEKPSFQQPWLCEATADAVAFLGPGAASHRYALEQFLVGGGLPRPGVR
jgi:hypothetical protein